MKIALDYDETFTAAPVLWRIFIKMCKEYGHDIRFVTYRDSRFSNEDICADAYDCGVEIIFTGGRQKQHIYEADIWIDDSPETIVSFEKLSNMVEGCLVNNDIGVIYEQ